AAEQVVFKKVSTGALNDLEKVTRQAFNMVAYFGLNEKIGNISFYDSTGQQEYQFNKPFSEKTAEIIDSEVQKLVEKAYKKAVDILEKNKEGLSKLAKVLIEKEVIFREDLVAVFGERPWDEGKEHISVRVENGNGTLTNETANLDSEQNSDAEPEKK
ncbi:MAG: hypothetical protein V1783_01460, partial [Bacteroidota bacterium]